MSWTGGNIDPKEIKDKVTNKTIVFAEQFGKYLCVDDVDDRGKSLKNHLTTNQLRKFFGEVKRQQMKKYNETDFVLLKPKLAYAVGRAKEKNAKIKDFYTVISNAIDQVSDDSNFKNFIKVFEAIVAYHKAYEPKNN